MNHPLATGSVALQICITSTDIEAMLDAYDSGMCDISTANCLSRAVARQLDRKEPIRLIRKNGREAHLVIEDHRVPVPVAVLDWLEEAEIGARCKPADFTLRLPKEVTPIREAGRLVPLLPVKF